jgi:hypothetical protein
MEVQDGLGEGWLESPYLLVRQDEAASSASSSMDSMLAGAEDLKVSPSRPPPHFERTISGTPHMVRVETWRLDLAPWAAAGGGGGRGEGCGEQGQGTLRRQADRAHAPRAGWRGGRGRGRPFSHPGP